MQKRIIPLDDVFMKDKKTHDKIYSFLQVNSYLTEDKRRIVYKDKITPTEIYYNVRKEIGKNKKNEIKYDISLQTVRNTLDLYERLNLIQSSSAIDIHNKNVKVYVLSQDFNYYQYIPLETLRYLVDTANENVIKVYAYLLNKYEWKSQEQQYYTFTLSELCKTIGYAVTSDNTKTMRNILKSLSNNALISYTETYYISENNTPIPTFRLDNAFYYIK
jgi:hypothetical protein